MWSRCEIKQESQGVSIRIRPERSIWEAIVLPILIIVFSPAILAMGWSGIVLWGMMGFILWRFAWNLFGFEEIAVAPQTLTITKRLLFLHRTRRCNSSEVDWIAYHPHAYRSPAGIGVLLKDNVMPFGIAYELKPADAETVLQAIKSNAPWLAARVRGTSETSFYKLA
jgi:hypothetical protein